VNESQRTIADNPRASPQQAHEIAAAHLEETRQRIAELERVAGQLRPFVDEGAAIGGAKIIDHLRGWLCCGSSLALQLVGASTCVTSCKSLLERTGFRRTAENSVRVPLASIRST
jgi:hypothetical protein